MTSANFSNFLEGYNHILSREVRISALGVGECLPRFVSSLILFVPVMWAFWHPHKGSFNWVYNAWIF